MSKNELEIEGEYPYPFPSLGREKKGDKKLSITQLLDDPVFRERFLKLADQSGNLNHLKGPPKEDGEEEEGNRTPYPISFSHLNYHSKRPMYQTNIGNQAEGLKELTFSLLSKSKTKRNLFIVRRCRSLREKLLQLG